MRFKEFVAWCNERACDGYWGMMQAITCIDILEQIRKKPFWRREKNLERRIQGLCRKVHYKTY